MGQAFSNKLNCPTVTCYQGYQADPALATPATMLYVVFQNLFMSPTTENSYLATFPLPMPPGILWLAPRDIHVALFDTRKNKSLQLRRTEVSYSGQR